MTVSINKIVNELCSELNTKSIDEITPNELRYKIAIRIRPLRPNLTDPIINKVIERLERYCRILKRDGIYLVDPSPDVRLLD
jgi:hypothetical protein